MKNTGKDPTPNESPATQQQTQTPKKSPKCKNMMLTQQKSYLPLPYQSISGLESAIVNKLHPKKYAIIEHDKDTDKNNAPVEPHTHAMLCFENARHISAVAKKLGIPEQYIAKWDENAAGGFIYLVHRTGKAQKEKKYQYDPAEVTANFNFTDFIAQAQIQFEKSKSESGLKPADMLDLLYAGCMTKDEIEKRMSGSEYGRNRRQIEDVYSKRLEIEADKWRREMKEAGRKISVVWMYGKTGTGKTRLAREYAESLKQSYYISGSSRDLFQRYAGEHTLILDELRPDVVKYPDLLRMLDPYGEQVMAPSRYFDKPLACDHIIITSALDPFSFYCETMKNERRSIASTQRIDAVDQLMRRIKVIIKFTDEYREAVKFNKDAVTNNLLDRYSRGHLEIAHSVYIAVPGTQVKTAFKDDDNQSDDTEALSLYWSIQGERPQTGDMPETPDNEQTPPEAVNQPHDQGG